MLGPSGEPQVIRAFEVRAKEQFEFEKKEKSAEKLWSHSRGDYTRYTAEVLGKVKRSYITRVQNIFEKNESEFGGYDKVAENIHQLWFLPMEYTDTTEWQRKLKYGDVLVNEGEVGMNKVGELSGCELTYAKCIQQQLITNKKAGKPVVILDVGGGLGLSITRLARYFEQVVSEGNVVFAVTNLGYTTDQWLQKLTLDYLQNADEQEVGKGNTPYAITQHELAFLKKYGRLVHSIKAAVTDLFKMKIKYQDGKHSEKEIELLGNTSMIIENNSVSLHDLIPSVHLPILGSILDDNGIWFSNNVWLGLVDKADNNRLREAELERSRQLTAQDYELEFVTRIEEGDKRVIGRRIDGCVMKKRNGPKVYGLASNLGSKILNNTYKPASSYTTA